MRDCIATLSATPDEVLAYYRNINGLMLAAMSEAAKIPADPELANAFKTIVYLMKLLEETNQQRSPLLRAFEQGSFKGLEHPRPKA